MTLILNHVLKITNKIEPIKVDVPIINGYSY